MFYRSTGFPKLPVIPTRSRSARALPIATIGTTVWKFNLGRGFYSNLTL
jgi:hypothetical protein